MKSLELTVEITRNAAASWYTLEIQYANGKRSVVGMGSDYQKATRLVGEWAITGQRSPSGTLITGLRLAAG